MRQPAGIPRDMAGMRAQKLAIELFVVAGAGLVLGLFGPFGTFAMPAPLRLLYWTGFLVSGFALFRPLIAVGTWLAEAFALPRWLATGLALSLASLPMTVLVQAAFGGFHVRALLAASDFLEIYLDVWLIGFLVNGLFWLLNRHPDEPAMPAPQHVPSEIAEPALPAFHDRLPPGFGPLLALAGEDHYVRAIGEGREALVLVRLRDAIAELAGVEGMQVHRSWWVARGGVASAKREGRTVTLVLAGGREIPVARDKVAALRQAGWIKP
jgi:LytTr DNA-binding domain